MTSRATSSDEVTDLLQAWRSGDPAAGESLLELRYFSGLELDEIALILDVSPTTAKSDWRFARAWLREALGGVS